MNKGFNIKDHNITIILSMLFKPNSPVSSLFRNLFHPFPFCPIQFHSPFYSMLFHVTSFVSTIYNMSARIQTRVEGETDANVV